MSHTGIEAIYPLSPMQTGMLFHTLYAPESGVYVGQLRCVLAGDLNVSAFKQACQTVISRHPVLRTVFVWEGLKEPRQVVHAQITLPWLDLDWRELSLTEQQEHLENFISSDRAKSFDLAKGPLLRLTLIQCAAGYYQFVWSSHHLLMDGWSSPLVLNEALTYYEAICRGQPIPIAKSRPYRDYILWLKQQDVAQAETFWRRRLAGFATPTSLINDKPLVPHGAKPLDGYAEQQIGLTTATTAQLQNWAQKNRLTLNTLVQGAWALLLNRYGGGRDVVYGTTVSGRPASLAGVETMVGLFINTLPVRVRMSPHDTLLPWLKGLQTELAEIRQYEFCPLSQIQNWSEVPHGTPLFESIVVFENLPMEQSTHRQNGGLQVADVHLFTKTNYPLTLVVRPGPELLLQLAYDGERFNALTITRLLGHLQTLLEGLLTCSDGRLGDLPLLTQAEQHQILSEWNTSARDYLQDQCVHHWFEAQVQQTPDATAVVFEEKTVTYAELNHRANQLAHYLQQRGVGPEVLVGLCLDRGPMMVLGLLGILKAGGAYVPLDPSYPQERLAFILSDMAQAQAGTQPLLLTQQHLTASLTLPGARQVLLDADWDQIACASCANPASGVTPQNPAYVIYTSGSTGQPKGVVVCHQNVARLFTATEEWFRFDAQDVWSLFHSYAFDFSVWELWGALCYGGRVVIVPYLVSRSPESFHHLLSEQQVTVLSQIPSAFRQLIYAEASLPTALPLALRYVIFGGEALELNSLRPWFARHGDQRPLLVNMYGITETTVHVTYRPVRQVDVDANTGSVIGGAIPDLELYVLDPATRQLLPIGVPGELYVGGAGLARGYLNQAGLSASRFIPNPFSRRAGERLYVTGDLVRYLPNGDLEYLGRIDHQVKVRGFRIELGEIEAVLSQHPDVREALVTVQEDSSSESRDKRLVAYLVCRDQAVPTVSELRQHLRMSLPDHMVPAAFVMLEAWPLTPSGKINRQALPAPDSVRPMLTEAFVTPRTKEEQALAEIWAEVLGLEQVGVQDNFFALGGDSILSIRVLAQARARGVSFTLPQLFQLQTIEALVRAIGTVPSEAVSHEVLAPFSLVSAEDRAKLSADIENAYPLTKLQAGMLFHSVFRPDTSLYQNISSYHLRGPLDEQKLRRALHELAMRHPILRTFFDLTNFSQPLQLVRHTVQIPLKVQDVQHLTPAEQEVEIEIWLEADRLNRFDWTQAPLLRFHVHRRSAETFQLSFTEHHAILDGWSVASMLTELFQIYLSHLGKNVPAPQPMPGSSYQDFVAAEHHAVKNQEQQRYWLEKLKGSSVITLPRLPLAFRDAKTNRVLAYRVPISLQVSDGLKQLAQLAGVPLKSVLLAAHLRVLSLISSRSDIVTGLVSNGRLEGTGGDRILGLFLNTLPLRLQLSAATWMELIRATFATERELLPFRLYPLAEIQKLHGGQPLFETAFNFVHFHVYQGILEFEKEIQILDNKGVQETNLSLLADFSLEPISSQVQLSLEYNTAELSEAQVAALGGYYARTLTAMAEHPHQPYTAAALLSTAERQQLVTTWNATH
ncbi:partial microcystin synthetase protein McyA, partial [Thermoflexales bacterium]